MLWREVDRLDRRVDEVATRAERLIAEARAELAADVDRISGRVDRLDEHGSRGVEALRLEVARLRGDLSAHEEMHTQAAREQRTARRWTIGVVAGLIAPLYPFVIAAVLR
ncbi:hypothetical protein DER29_4352 [Micromonospora sp. M71_S20]|uniref:hypothetical protein n=1 Tax=Micromonospora sp. M71_S20 TaxID=592872 RepID=UPI000EB2143D|nr:hypothetical protein [Micromonospora sp. M71_S20]RLK13334.1 hypothetical protein DER29_4352 [Micromonospora sp. M71_S20]